ncbi:hypothetical protein ACFOLD_10605 [Kocuria carniphila]|uniref:hypothetical protein n=1 Tax=Kocuria carniphila TaxID=262208 RepID=UPI00361A16C0
MAPRDGDGWFHHALKTAVSVQGREGRRPNLEIFGAQLGDFRNQTWRFSDDEKSSLLR